MSQRQPWFRAWLACWFLVWDVGLWWAVRLLGEAVGSGSVPEFGRAAKGCSTSGFPEELPTKRAPFPPQFGKPRSIPVNIRPRKHHGDQARDRSQMQIAGGRRFLELWMLNYKARLVRQVPLILAFFNDQSHPLSAGLKGNNPIY